jgi:HSP20 family molecular chaperone IbpA
MRRNAHIQTGRTLERLLSDASARANQPTTQFKQDDDAFHLVLDMPGISKEQLAISTEGTVVRIASREGAARQYRAAYELPHDIDATQSNAKLENGVLTLKLTKKIPVSQSTEISIN